MRKIIGALALGVSTAASAGYTNIYFFGDSLTDVGNVAEVYSQLPHPPGAPAEVPGAPYDAGGRASNGPLYADVLANGLGFSLEASERGGTNYAFGGARTRYQVFGQPFDGVIDQVNAFRALSGPADANALYVLWAGSNNLQDILTGKTTDALGNPVPGVADTLGDIIGMIGGLYAEGARHLLVPNVVNLTQVPRLAGLPAPAKAQATGLIQAFNHNLDLSLDGLALQFSDLDIVRFDAYSAFDTLVRQAGSHGITNTTDRCYTGDDLNFTGGGTVCADPDAYLFWDGIHPTAAAHAILGRQMLVATVPEPGTTLLCLAALAAVGATRRRARGSATA